MQNPTKNNNLNFESVERTRVEKILMQLKCNNSDGMGVLSTRFLKLILPKILNAITLIINQCMDTSICPDSIRTAEVIPLHTKR